MNGEEIEVTPGTYNEAIDFLGKAIRLYSSGGPEVTTIDANGIPGAYHVVQCANGEDANTVLDGFTITGGNADGPDPNDQSGGGMFNYQSSPTVINCMFIGNTAVTFGGGMSNINNSSPRVTSCTFSGNNATYGGGMHTLNNSNPTVTNCTFSGNTAISWGAGMRNFESSPTVTNCTFSDNTVKYQSGGGMHNHKSNTTITNCIFWDNAPDEIYDAQSSSIVSYSDVQGGWPGTDNIDTDPCFVQSGYWDANSVWVYGDYHLLSGSPCIDAGDPNYVAEPNETDLDGNPRIVDGDNDGIPVIDMGAYEKVTWNEVTMKFTPQALNCKSKGKWVKAHFVLPAAYTVEDVNANAPAIIEPFGTKSDQMKVVVNEYGLVEINADFDRTTFCDTLTESGCIEITVRGFLLNGHSFYDTDAIRIIDNSFEHYFAFLSSQWLRTDCNTPDWCQDADFDCNYVVNLNDFASMDFYLLDDNKKK
ncbi:MAG: choice-of-anchor Q domain-containing protein [Planctomycetota bacterium]